MTDNPVRYAVVGRGWRAQFFFRLAELMPERFTVTGVMTRSVEAAAEVAGRWRLPVTQDLGELLATGPEYVITSVPWGVNPGLVGALVERDVPVLSETPPAPDREGLRRLWERVGKAERVQVAEQYLLLPDHAARLAVLRAGAIGEPTSAQVSSTHGYHAVSMLRGLLGVGMGPAAVHARTFTAPLADPLSPAGWRDDATPKPATTTLATIDFGDGRSGLYDFTDNQWWNPLRSRRVVVRGSLGELVDDRVLRLRGTRTFVETELRRRQTGRDLNLEGFDLDHVSFGGEVVYTNPYQGVRLSDEEIAIATILESTGRWARGEAEAPYPLAQACQDHLISLAIDESARTGALVSTTPEPWHP